MIGINIDVENSHRHPSRRREAFLLSDQLIILSRNLQHIAAIRHLGIEALVRKTHIPIRILEAIWRGDEIPDAAALERISNALGVRVMDLLEEEPDWMASSYFGGRVH